MANNFLVQTIGYPANKYCIVRSIVFCISFMKTLLPFTVIYYVPILVCNKILLRDTRLAIIPIMQTI
jgi:hypothetical protein